MTLQHKFTNFIPEKIEDGILYISIEYCTAIHKCVCGCGNEVVTPISPTDWKLTFNGKSVTFYPSIGNWNFECQSHYWIRGNMVEFADRWSDQQIHLGRENDLERKNDYFGVSDFPKKKSIIVQKRSKPTIWQRICSLFSS